MPPVTSLGMEPCVTRLTKTDEVIPVMRTAFSKRGLMVDFLNGNHDTILKALLTERVGLYITVTYPFPDTAVSFPCLGVSSVAFILSVVFLLMFLAEPSFRKIRTAGMMAGVLCFPWHRNHLRT